MRPLIVSLLALTLAAGAATAQTVPMDTLVLRRVGPGMTYVRIVAPSVPWSIDVLELDRTNPYLDIETVEANGLRAGGYETVSSMAARLDGAAHHVVGAINGDFFIGGGDTRNAAVVGGQVVRRSAAAPALQPSIGFDAANAVSISKPSVGGALLTPSDTLAITGYNEPRGADALVLYNAFQGPTTGTDAGGTEVVIRPTGGWIVNDTVEAVVERVAVGAGDAAIPDGWAVLSGTGGAGDALGRVAEGARVRVVATVTPGRRGLEDLISGRPLLLVGGRRFRIARDPHNSDRHPRTSIGVNADTSRIYFVTVDGRQSSSAGMTNFEVQDFLLSLGITDAIGLDGGGSTAMVIRGELANSPSGAERPVGNGLLAISTAPVGPLAHLQATPFLSSLFLGESVQISVVGTDAFYTPLEIDAAAVAFRVDPVLGSVTPDGLFTATPDRSEPASGYVFVDYGALSDSVRVDLRVVGRIDVEPSAVVTDTILTVPFAARATDSGGRSQALPEGRVAWEVLDPSVGSISPDGVFSGRAAGVTRVVATYSPSVRDTATVEVQIGAGELNLSPLDAPSDWQIVTDGVDEASFEAVDDPDASGGKALRLRYRFTRGARPPTLQLRTRLPIYGLPDSLRMNVRTDGQAHIVRYLLENPAADPLVLAPQRYADDTAFARIAAPFARAVPSVDLSYPVVFTGIHVLPALSGVEVGEETSGELVFDDLWVTYPSGRQSTDAPAGPQAAVGQVRVFPSPSSNAVSVVVDSPAAGRAQVHVFDVLGRLAATVFDGAVVPGEQTLSAGVEGLPPGLYLVRATLDGQQLGAAVPLVVAR